MIKRKECANNIIKLIKIIFIFLLIMCVKIKAQETSKVEVLHNYSEQFKHDAQYLVDWNQLNIQLSNNLKIDLSEATHFFYYAFDKGFINYDEYLKKVKEGVLSKENALQYWLDQMPYFSTLYRRELKVTTSLQEQVRPYNSIKPSGVPSCNNLNFSDGTTSNWNAKWNNTKKNEYKTLAQNLPNVGFNSSGFNSYGYVHELVTDDGPDKYAGIKKVPPGHTTALRLGDDKAILTSNFPFHHQVIANTFTVDAKNSCITYWYAIVFSQEKGSPHEKADQPYFRIRLFDDKNNELECASYDVNASEGEKKGFQTKLINFSQEAVYKDWVSIYIPLVQYIGKKITIQFESSDCNVGGHMGYSYLAVDCSPFEIAITNPICGDDKYTLTAPIGANSYLWTGPGVPLAPNNKNQVVSVNMPGKYTVELKVIGNNGVTCTYSIDTTILENTNLPAADFSAPSTCEGQPTLFTDLSTPIGNITSWSWDFNNDGVEDSNIQHPTYTFASSGTFSVKLKITQGDCKAEVIKNVSVNSIPTANFSATTVCLGYPTVFIDQSIPTDSITEWSWDFNSDGVEDSKLQNPTYTFVKEGIFSVKLKIQKDNCVADTIQNIVVQPPPILKITDPLIVCYPQTVDLTARIITNGSTNVDTLSYWMDSVATNPLLNPKEINLSGTYYIKSSKGNCYDIKPVKVIINPLPPSNAGIDVSICTGDSAMIGVAAIADYNYLWMLPPNTPATGLNNNTLANPTVKLYNTGKLPITKTYIVETTNKLTGCKSFDSVYVVVGAMPTANAGTSQSVCVGTSIKLNGAIGGAATSSIWMGGSGFYDKDSNQLNAIYKPSSAEYDAGTVKLTLITDDPAGACTLASSDVTFNFYKNPIIDFVVDTPKGCPVHCVNFTDSTKINPDHLIIWQWNFGDGSAKENTQNPSHCYNKPGYYDVTLIGISNNGCKDTLTKKQMIEVFKTPIAEFDLTPNIVSLLDPLVAVTNLCSTDVTFWHYSFGDGDTLGNTTPNTTHLYPDKNAETYFVNLIVKNANGCTATTTHKLITIPEFTFYIPNAFTPNNDGNNDTFFGTGMGIEKYNLWIFDRWGNLIFHTEKLEEGWDGKLKNGEEALLQDVYVWKVKIKDIFKKNHDYIGTVTLFK
jgi:gliding motility-associated-like protein